MIIKHALKRTNVVSLKKKSTNVGGGRRATQMKQVALINFFEFVSFEILSRQK